MQFIHDITDKTVSNKSRPSKLAYVSP